MRIATNGAVRMLFVIALAAFAGAVTGAQVRSVRTVASTLQIMKMMTAPLSDAVFEAAAEPPKDAPQWLAVHDQALKLAEAGNLLMIGDRVRDRGEWMKLARAQVDAADVAMKAAEAKNAERLSNASDALYETCANCHEKYLLKK